MQKNRKPLNDIPKSAENRPNTRSTSSRRGAEKDVPITFIGSSRTVKADLPEFTNTRSRRPLHSESKKELSRNPVSRGEEHSSSLPKSSPESSVSVMSSNASLWSACTEEVNKIGVCAKRESRNLRVYKMKSFTSNMEQILSNDNQLAPTVIRILNSRNSWCLNSCHACLTFIMENITSDNYGKRSACLKALASITNSLLDTIIGFASTKTRRIGVDVVAEERAAKATECIHNFRKIVKNRDKIYKQIDQETIYKLDAILERLKKVSSHK